MYIMIKFITSNKNEEVNNIYLNTVDGATVKRKDTSTISMYIKISGIAFNKPVTLFLCSE